MNIDDWKSQVKRGTLELCILSLLSKRDYYGYELIEVLSNWSIIATNENTMYPLLRRLTKESYLEGYWQENNDLPRRKYYRITDLGIRYLMEMTVLWKTLTRAVDDIQENREEL
ncbi:PadR family transcriptional regulator [Enterococcus sp. BWB1-3]|uniref:PadR family transcriptional regulator n=1 Tax=unclassified Enterococcus TaxID=2608891 RepID=UPI001923BDDC|nr:MULTISPECIES: PadR family transcriptional regulator [unclassified Enterococcus]MBL1229386.1 PadR family transcriptional regulator [Enterococcus sp. BWB1-3]MCB5951309.1 PadR family transcriptional regulator [Enterococcus sp. BWT-B8]